MTGPLPSGARLVGEQMLKIAKHVFWGPLKFKPGKGLGGGVSLSHHVEGKVENVTLVDPV